MKKVYVSSEKTGAPLSGAVEVNGMVFVSGQIHMKEGQLQGETIEEQFEIAINNVMRILGEAGLTLDDVIKVQLYLTDLSQLPALNKVYGNYFKQPLPARTAVGVTALPLNAHLEIDVVASR
jgi:2-iminobutanoate/2-iminopropanoate deaminase